MRREHPVNLTKRYAGFAHLWFDRWKIKEYPGTLWFAFYPTALTEGQLINSAVGTFLHWQWQNSSSSGNYFALPVGTSSGSENFLLAVGTSSDSGNTSLEVGKLH
uniref:Uncharacterized protein n=1 Tax=Tanacetum cinerariifolium TaxID=118510 RepID=A0A6L2LA41_TANCI|nr:hypothetical protein [Tanacetum cinerariifolium]